VGGVRPRELRNLSKAAAVRGDMWCALTRNALANRFITARALRESTGLEGEILLLGNSCVTRWACRMLFECVWVSCLRAETFRMIAHGETECDWATRNCTPMGRKP
jgi:hypothetical protein